LLTLVSCLDRTRRGTTVPIGGIAIVTLFTLAPEQDAITTVGHASPSTAIGLDIAKGRAAVTNIVIAVVAALRSLLVLITASGRMTRVCAGVTRTRPALLALTGARATVVILGITVVTTLVEQQDPVATLSDAFSAREWASVARLDFALVTTVGWIRIGVVASFRTCDLAVTTLVHVGAGHAWRRTLEAGLDRLTVCGTTVSADGVFVVALLPQIEGHDPVAAHLDPFARTSGNGTEPACFFMAIDVATVTGSGIAVVTSFVTLDAFITAELDALAGLARRRTYETTALHRAIGTTTVIGIRVAVVANFTRFDFSVAAQEDRNARRSLGRTVVVEFYLTDPGATITR
jgi:hypothetical protein